MQASSGDLGTEREETQGLLLIKEKASSTQMRFRVSNRRGKKKGFDSTKCTGNQLEILLQAGSSDQTLLYFTGLADHRTNKPRVWQCRTTRHNRGDTTRSTKDCNSHSRGVIFGRFHQWQVLRTNWDPKAVQTTPTGNTTLLQDLANSCKTSLLAAWANKPHPEQGTGSVRHSSSHQGTEGGGCYLQVSSLYLLSLLSKLESSICSLSINQP